MMAPAVELPIVLFDGSKHMTKTAVSQVRSHAMRSVQRKKFETQQTRVLIASPRSEDSSDFDVRWTPSSLPSDQSTPDISTQSRKRVRSPAYTGSPNVRAKRQERDHSDCAHRMSVPSDPVDYSYPSNPDPLILEVVENCKFDTAVLLVR